MLIQPSGPVRLEPVRSNTTDGTWDVRKSAQLYGINYWGSQYFSVNEKGNVEVSPSGKEGAKVDLFQLTNDLVERGIRTPILIRFPDIVKSRIELISGCFARAMGESAYRGKYSGVYPIKVNHQRHLVEEIVDFGRSARLGLECGSKPELLIALALMNTPEALIVCNGFKDSEYIETALLAQKLGRNIFVVVDRSSELEMIVTASKKLQIRPFIGFRSKLNSQGAGRWIDSSGARSKFGLTPSEIVHGVNYLKKEGMLDCLQLLHFHIGSQIPSIQSIKSSIKEGARYFTELYKMGANLKYIDVGGGLGVDYDGTGKTDSSTNYSEQEYANDVVTIIQSICDEKDVPHPDIVSESGRSLVAHTSILIFDVLGYNEVAKKQIPCEVSGADSRLVQDFFEIYNGVTEKNINEYFNDLIEKKKDTLNLFSYGALNLEQRAKAEDLYWATITKMNSLARNNPEAEDILKMTEKELSDTYFCNFSVFQSMPDSWALEQVFPIMPIHRLDNEPARRAVLVDLTCDSDGKVDSFIDIENGSSQNHLAVHDLEPAKPYFLGCFLLGAYQEILGDLHNLFGDTDAVHISVTPSGYTVDHVVEGDTVTEVLAYVEYERPHLIEKVRKATEAGIANGTMSPAEARLFLKHYEEGLSGYTYLEDLGQ